MYPIGAALLDSLNPRAKTFVVVSSPHSSAGSPAPGEAGRGSYRRQKEKPKGVKSAWEEYNLRFPWCLFISWKNMFQVHLSTHPKKNLLRRCVFFCVSFLGANTEPQEVFGCQGRGKLFDGNLAHQMNTQNKQKNQTKVVGPDFRTHCFWHSFSL